MKNMIDIDATSFFRSTYKKLYWSLKEQYADSATISTQKSSDSRATDPKEALKEHINNIASSISGRLIDYEITLLFDQTIGDREKELFTDIFNEYNTKDEST